MNWLSKKIFMWLVGIQRRARKRSLREAIEKAKKITNETSKKVLIYFVKGEYHVMTKQEMKTRWHNKEFIGHTVQEMEKAAEVKIESYDRHKKQPGETQRQEVV